MAQGAVPEHHLPVQERGPPRVVRVARTAAIEAAREGLPIVGMEQEVMEAVNGSDVVLLCGETGCGKTTQASTASCRSVVRHGISTVALVYPAMC